MEERRGRHLARSVGYVSLGVGAVAGAVAIGTSVLMLGDKSDRDANCTDKVCNAEGVTANSRLADLGGWNAGAWAVAVLGAGAGAFLLLTNPADPERGTAVGVSPTGSGAGLTLRSSF